MTDLRDTLRSLADPPLLPPDSMGELDGRRRRRARRRQARRALAVAVAMAVVGAAGMLTGGGDRPTRVTAGPGDRVGALGAAADPDAAVATGPVAAPSRSTATTVAPPPGPGPSTGPCRNSHDRACGPFRWDPEPAEAPVEVQAEAYATTIRVGQEAAFIVRATSPVSPVRATAAESGDGGTPRPDVDRGCADPGYAERFGPWELPPPRPNEYSTVYRWTYVRPGTYVARFAFAHWTCDPEQYPQYPGAGEVTVTVTVTVVP